MLLDFSKEDLFKAAGLEPSDSPMSQGRISQEKNFKLNSRSAKNLKAIQTIQKHRKHLKMLR